MSFPRVKLEKQLQDASTMFVVVALYLAVSGLVSGTGTGRPSCKVSDVQVQANFDFSRYLGRWYIWERFFQRCHGLECRLDNHQHTYLLESSGEADVFVRGRAPDGVCKYVIKGLRVGSVPGKLGHHGHVGHHNVSVDYWVLSTDYTRYAVVYGCRRKRSDDTCAGAYSYILVRSALDGDAAAALTAVNDTLNSVCLNRQNFRKVNHSNEECLQCERPTWTIQPNFDLQRYLGVWYEIVFKPRLPFPEMYAFTNYYDNYTLGTNGTINNVINARNHSGQCLLFTSTSLGTTAQPGKMKFFDEQTTPEGDDYWVIETDYNGYAFILGCVRLPTTPPERECDGFRSWVFTRTPYLSGSQFVRVLKLFRQYCINEDDFFTTPHDNPCP